MGLDVVLEPGPLGDPIEEPQGCLRVNVEGKKRRDKGRGDGGGHGSQCGVLLPVRGGENREELGNRRCRRRWGKGGERSEEEEALLGRMLKGGGCNNRGGGCQGGGAGTGGG